MVHSLSILCTFVLGGLIGFRIGVRRKIHVLFAELDSYCCGDVMDGWFFPSSVITLRVVERTPEDTQFSSELKLAISKLVRDKRIVIDHRRYEFAGIIHRH